MTTHLFHLLKIRYSQLGGLRLVREYAREGLLWPAVKTVLKHPFSRKTYKQVYLNTVRKVEPILVKQYKPLMKEFAAQVSNEGTALPHEHPKTIWFCWLQGLENAPEVVKACYHSLVRHLGIAGRGSTGSPTARNEGYEIIVIDGKNWREYVDLPEYVVEKWRNGLIPAAHFSDLLRLQLLIRFGGTWIDSTILCTGFDSEMTKAGLDCLDADLFILSFAAFCTNKS